MKAIRLSVFCLAALGLLQGCEVVEEPIEIDRLPTVQMRTPAEPAVIVDESSPKMEQRFTEPDQQNTSAVDSAIMWSQKYDEMLSKNESLMEKNRTIFLENSDLRRQVGDLQAELARTKKELEEANAFLQEVHGELTRWKSDVLGFRDETRAAQTAQLEALARILGILGAEPAAVDAAGQAAESDTK